MSEFVQGEPKFLAWLMEGGVGDQVYGDFKMWDEFVLLMKMTKSCSGTNAGT